ncbi:GroES-like protein [Yamadazyma tenuis ATCC 10573]|uniref:GroES-like protein n=2 Tax=Candida tenuis (strain ATCC 10573 / BCRC 21748 / CBS 615 / JCM 9827 / NBRC 10315 / NRRL Y-1498 / VKM Y-70) TaxID=590646 RepID=G3BCK0_CANTC|nr:GroES-like protein [Yamadazyma tenuis ATCC 10573]EGV61042.1 GroES-like protein [Yamadazyma tenuis ATCC 10573]
MSYQTDSSMKAVIYRGPYDFRVETVPRPQIGGPTDVILQVKHSGICGTDLHTYRGNLKSVQPGQVLGHEFTGTVVAVGDRVLGFVPGDTVVSTFTIQCGECWYCKNGKSGQCDITNTFGKTGLPGGQAEYVRVPFADNTLVKIPEMDVSYVMMADIFTTGYYGVKKIVDQVQHVAKGHAPKPLDQIEVLQLGLGPVGECALQVMKYLGFKNVTCVDNVPDRLKKAEELGFKPVNFDDGADTLGEYDYVLEVVGSSSALKTAFDHVRRDGLISSLGMGHEPLPFTAMDCYLKNINLSFGRCHAWSLFPEALEIFQTLKGEFRDFVDTVIPVEKAAEGYRKFDAHEVNKVVIEF